MHIKSFYWGQSLLHVSSIYVDDEGQVEVSGLFQKQQFSAKCKIAEEHAQERASRYPLPSAHSPEPVILLVCVRVSSMAQTRRIAGSGDESTLQCSLHVLTFCHENSVTHANLHLHSH